MRLLSAFILAAILAAPARAASPTPTVFDVKAFGAVGDGSADDTAAIQRALNKFTNGTAAIATGAIYFPPGTYRITSSLYYVGDNSHGLRLYGAVGGTRGPTGSRLMWDGAAGGTLFIFNGANGLTVDDMEFDGNHKAKYAVHLAATINVSTTLGTTIAAGTRAVTPGSIVNIATGTLVSVDSGANFEFVYVASMSGSSFTATFVKPHASTATIGGGAGSSGSTFRRDTFIAATGTGSADFAAGNYTSGATVQVSEVNFVNCHFGGDAGQIDDENGLLVLDGGNTKNFNIFGGTMGDHLIHVNGYNSGTYEIIGTIMGNSHTSDIHAGGNVHLVGIESEATNSMFFKSTIGAGPGNLNIDNCSWQGSAGNNGTIISWGGNLSVIGNSFYNLETSTTIPTIAITGTLFPGGTAGYILSQGNYYQNAPAGYAPLYDTSGNALLPSYYNHQPVSVTSRGDYGGPSSGTIKLNSYTTVTRLASQQASFVADVGMVVAGDTDTVVAFRNHANNGDVVGLTKSTSDVVAVGDAAGVSVSGPFKPLVKTKAQLAAITPAAGDTYLCSDCTDTYSVVVGTGATVAGFRESGTTHGLQ